MFSRITGRISLATRLSIAMAGAMLIGAAVLLITSAVQEKAHFSQELDGYLDEEMNTLQMTLAEPVVTGDYATIKKILNDSVESLRIENATYADSSGNKIASRDRPVASRAPHYFLLLVHMPTFAKTETIAIGGRNYGTITLSLTTTPITNFMWSRLVKNTQVLLLALVLLLVVTTAIVRFSLRPLAELEAGARRIGSGDYATRIPEQGDGEMVLTISAFNRMAEQLRQTLDSLKRIGDRYSLLYNETPVMLHSIDRSANLVEVNDYWLQTLGYERDEVIGRKVTDFLTEASRRHAEDVVQPAFFRDGIIKDIPYQFVRKNGVVVDALLSATAERDAAGNIVRSLAVIEDVTDRKRTARELREKEGQYRLLFETANDGIFIQDATGFIDCNKKGAEMYGLTREQVIGRSPSVFAPERQPDGRLSSEVAGEKVRLAMNGLPQMFEWQPMRADGSPFDVEITLSRFDLGGSPCLQAIVRDIGERKRLEQERLKSQKLEAIGTLAGGIAHDFNNLLQGVFGYISLARLKRDDKERSLAALEEAEKALHRSVKLTNQLLTFSKGGRPVKKPIDLLPVIENAARFALSGSRTDYRITAADGLSLAEADDGQIGQVIQNIVLNGDQAMPEGGRVEIAVSNVQAPDPGLPQGLEKGNYIEIAIKDSGIGIPEEYLGRIFDPYFTTKEKGSGLGLATSYSIIKNHNGLIDVASGVAKGTVFRIYLPAIQKGQKNESTQEAETAAPGRVARVLLMDDERVILDIGRALLEELGHRVECAVHGEEAIEKYRTAKRSGKPFDIVILDLTIRGGMGGAETVRILREIDPGVKVIVSSGYSEDGAVSTCQQIGFNAFLNKPYDARNLQDVLNKVLSA